MTSEMLQELERVAQDSGVAPADVIRMCVKFGLPVVEAGFKTMKELIEEKIATEKESKKR
jgi:DNA-binding MurR/RpiR family transcriptional regulator